MDKGAKDNITPIGTQSEEPRSYDLNRLELIAVKGIQAQINALDEYIQAQSRAVDDYRAARQSGINEQTRELCNELAARLGIPSEAIGTTHALDFARGALVPKQSPQSVAESNTAQAG